MIKSEFKRAILSKKFLVIIFVGILFYFLGGFNEIRQYIFFDFNAPDIQTPKLQASSKQLVNNGLNMYSVWFDCFVLYTPLMPILAALPFSYSYLEDTKNGMIKYINIRIDHKKYLTTKFLINGLAGGIGLSLPTVILTIVVSILFTGNINDFSGNGLYGGIFSDLVIHNFYMYTLVHMLIQFFFGFAYSNIALSVSAFIKNTIAVMLSPFLFWIGATLILQFFNINSYLPTSINQFYLIPKVTLSEIVIELLLIILFSFIIFILKAKKRNIYE